MNKRICLWSGILLMLLACNLGAATPIPTPNLLATLAASTPLAENPNAAAQTSIPPASSSSTDQPSGQIAYTCQIYKVQASNQICLINADGTGFRRLTTDDTKQHYYPSISPDGKSVTYAAFREANVYEIYEIKLASGNVIQLTNRLGILNGPEISPDGKFIVFKYTPANSETNAVWVMDRNGQNPHPVPNAIGWDPTWSPDGQYILFASDMNGTNQLYTIRTDGEQLKKISNLPAIRGRSDWSADGQFIVTYSGESWNREVYIMNVDGSNAHVLSPVGGNSQGPSFSPDGQWVTFTAYFDKPTDIHGCEIYIMRIDGTDLRRLTNNDYCDYQPRWGP